MAARQDQRLVMITTLLIVALVLTLLIALMLPFGGWGSGMDAAGKGMAIFFPMILMSVRFLCFTVAAILLASGGYLAWSGLPGFVSGAIAVALVSGLGLLSFAAANLLGESPRGYGRTSFAFLSIIVAPVLAAMWMFAERFGVEPAQVWIIRGLLLACGLAPLALLARIRKRDAEDSAAHQAEEAAAEAAARAKADNLPADASLLAALRFYDALTDHEWRERGHVMERIKARPDLQQEYAALLVAADLDDRLTAGVHATALSPKADEAYYRAVLPTLETIVAELEGGTGSVDHLVRVTQAGIRLAWPAIHNTSLPRELMQRLHAAIVARGEPLANYQHDARMLAEYVVG